MLRSQSSLELGEGGRCSALSHFFESLPCQLSGGKQGAVNHSPFGLAMCLGQLGEAQAINGVTGAGALGELCELSLASLQSRHHYGKSELCLSIEIVYKV